MFPRKPAKDPNQSQTMSNITQNSGVIQQGQAGGDLFQSQSGSPQTQQQITHLEVVRHLETLEKAVKDSPLIEAQKEELLDYLRPAKREAAKEEGSQELVAHNLKKVNETLKTVKETTETGKSLWETGQTVFKAIAPWLGTAAKLLGL